MNYKKVFWGVVLIMVGLLFVLKNMNIICFNWFQFLNLWPILLVLWGISLLPLKGFIKLILSLVIVVLGVFLVYKYDRSTWFEFFGPRSYKYNREHTWKDSQSESDDNSYRREGNWKTQHLFYAYSPEIQKAKFDLDAAAGTFYLKEVTDQLIEINKEGNIGNYSLTSQEARDTHIVRLSMEETTIRGDKLRHKVDIKLHKDPVWDLDMDIGAARIDMDLTPFKINNIEIDGGASSITMRLGDLYPEMNVDIDAGVSSILIKIPESSGCRVKTNSVLSDREMKGFKKLGTDRYETENFEESTNKILIAGDVAISKIEIKRY